MLIEYQPRKFSAASLAIVDRANEIIAEYAAEGFELTLRQLYYQFVARGLLPNQHSEYKRLGSVINDARLAGLVSWEAIVDRTRRLEATAHWDSPADAVGAVADQYHRDLWETQSARVEVWVEKEALAGVVESIVRPLDVPYFCCRGYTSQSEMWVAAQRMLRYIARGQTPVVIHLGDHDPSGIDMSRDIIDRLTMFIAAHNGDAGELDFVRLALTMEQIDRYQPPPNPAKATDARFAHYAREFGSESWELDALDPPTLRALVEREVARHRDERAWTAQVERQERERALLRVTAGVVADLPSQGVESAE